jgi:hypothetical protein
MYPKLKNNFYLLVIILLVQINFHSLVDLSTSYEVSETFNTFEINSTLTTVQDENGFSSDISHTSDTTNSVITQTSRPNYCKELFPKCSCLSSPLIIQCNNFTRFDELDFTLLLDKNSSNKSKTVYELELEPLQSQILDKNLNLTGIELNNRIILRNINGFDIISNPFQSVGINKSLNLFVYNSKLEFYLFANETEKKLLIDDCRLDLFKEDFFPLFSSFNYIFLGNDVKYSQLCPLIFQNSNIRQIEFSNLNLTNHISFVNLIVSNKTKQLNSKVLQVRVFDSKNLTLDDAFLNGDVFRYLDSLNFDYVNLKKIEDDTFKNLNSLRSLIINIENLEQFITSSNNTWMKNLNYDVKIDYNKTDLNIEDYYNKSLLITINSRNNNQNYLYSSNDLKHFQYFPHENYVFLRILSQVNLECSSTVQFLLKYGKFYKNPQTLNTTSVNKCFLINQLTSIATSYRTTIQSETTNSTRFSTSSSSKQSSSTRLLTSTIQTIKNTTQYMFSTGAYIGNF